MGTATQVTVTRIAILLRHKDIEYRPEAQVPYLAYLCALALLYHLAGHDRHGSDDGPGPLSCPRRRGLPLPPRGYPRSDDPR
jgi:hypothetical protein